LHAVLCAAGYNIKWLLRMIARKAVAFLQSVFLCLQQVSGLGRSWAVAAMVWAVQAARLAHSQSLPQVQGRMRFLGRISD
jgi:hypothetical protein